METLFVGVKLYAPTSGQIHDTVITEFTPYLLSLVRSEVLELKKGKAQTWSSNSKSRKKDQDLLLSQEDATLNIKFGSIARTCSLGLSLGCELRLATYGTQPGPDILHGVVFFTSKKREEIEKWLIKP